MARKGHGYGECDVVVAAQAALGETPVWDYRYQVLYWVDILGKAVHRYEAETDVDACFAVPALVSSVALGAKNLVLTLKDRLAAYTIEGDQLEKLPPVLTDEGVRFNDARVDPCGRFWAGSMDIAEREPLGGLYVFCDFRKPLRVGGPMVVSNGLDFSPDGSQLYHIDSHCRTVDRWVIEEDPLRITNRQPLFEVPAHFGEPDGMVMDTDGMIWLTTWGGGWILRFDQDGRLLQKVKVPVSQPTGLTFGGGQLGEIYFTSARDGLTPDRLQMEPMAGAVFRMETEAQGRPSRLAVFG